jgi:hypothetical protein
VNFGWLSTGGSASTGGTANFSVTVTTVSASGHGSNNRSHEFFVFDQGGNVVDHGYSNSEAGAMAAAEGRTTTFESGYSRDPKQGGTKPGRSTRSADIYGGGYNPGSGDPAPGGHSGEGPGGCR